MGKKTTKNKKKYVFDYHQFLHNPVPKKNKKKNQRRMSPAQTEYLSSMEFIIS